jgi:hypothetical protein
VPIFDLPKNLSLTLSIVRWYGVIKWALVEILSFEVSTPRSFKPLISLSSTAGSITTPLPITGITFGDKIPDGSRWSAYF